ncbi:MAG: UDP-N-acetylglucosamine 2-epimerase (non-hydrolyzing) [Pseudomonadales bacterium]
MKIVTIIGARPQFIKAATLSREIEQHGPAVEEILVHTGQHYDANMSQVFFDELDIPRPHYNLGVGGGTHGQNTGRMLESVETILIKERPDWVLVYGDTDSTLAGALAGSKLNISVAHVEAGLRSYNRRMPEEVNRVLTDHLSDLLFAPTITAIHNLTLEGIVGDKVLNVGDVMYDAAVYYMERAKQRSTILSKLKFVPKSYCLATVHRAENTEDPATLRGILEGLSTAEYPIVMPLHPRTRGRIKDFGINIPTNICVIDPVGYLDMISLEANALLIVTDSGGVQKEAYFHKVPCLTLREETEWVELVDLGVNELIGVNRDTISSALQKDVNTLGLFDSEIYGSGDAASKILTRMTQVR